MSEPVAALETAHLPGRQQQLQANLALLAVCAVWGATFVMVKDALAFAGPHTFNTLRFGIAAVLLLGIVAARPAGESWNRRTWGAGLLCGVALFAGYAFQTVGLQLTTASRAAFITGMSVVLVPLVLALLMRRPVGRGVWGGVALAVLGLALLSLGPDLFSGGPAFAQETLVGDLLVFGGALSFAAHILLLGHFAPSVPALPLTLAQVVMAALLGAGFTLAFEQPRWDGLWSILPAAAFTGVFATVVAFVVQAWAQRFTPPTHAALIFATEPVFGGLFAYLLIGETLAPAAILGCALILVGMVVVQVAE